MNSTTLPTSVDFDGARLSIVDHNGQPYITAADLSRALGYSDQRAVNRIYARHASEFTEAMTCGVKLTPQPSAVGLTAQAREQRLYSPRGCGR